MIEALLGHGEADQAASVLGHEVDGFGRDLLGGEGEVAFVLAVFVVDDHDHAAGADLFDRVGDVGKGFVIHDGIIVASRIGTEYPVPRRSNMHRHPEARGLRGLKDLRTRRQRRRRTRVAEVLRWEPSAKPRTPLP